MIAPLRGAYHWVITQILRYHSCRVVVVPEEAGAIGMDDDGYGDRQPCLGRCMDYSVGMC